MKLMSYTLAMRQGLVPQPQSMMPQAPQGPSLAGGMLGVGMGQEGDGNLILTLQGGAGDDALKELLPRSGPQETQPGHHLAVHNKDGSISTVRSISVGMHGKEYPILAVSDDGKILTEREAVDSFKQTGKHFGVLISPEAATRYARKLHEDQEKQYAPKVRLGGAMPDATGSAPANSSSPVGSASAHIQGKDQMRSPKGSTWERMPDKYEAYTKAFGKRPDRAKLVLAVKELDTEFERLAEEKPRGGVDRPN